MEYEVGFYIHHHGNGHLMRSISIAKEFTDKKITFLGSNLSAFKNIIPGNIDCIHLPLDVANLNETTDEAFESCKNFHYAPLHIAGLRERNNLLTNYFVNHFPLILVVDTSTEIVTLARLCGIATVVILQNGNRNDLPHLLAYDSAVKIIAPFAKTISPDLPAWVKHKTFYAGGFSKYNFHDKFPYKQKTISVLIGAGGTSINFSFLFHLATQVPNYLFKIIGKITIDKISLDNLPANLLLFGRLDNPLTELQNCCLIIGNAGHNTVMEVASLNKHFICIPEERPFFEQLDKADKIKHLPGIKVILPNDIMVADWNSLISETLNHKLKWGNMINPYATKSIRVELDKLSKTIFNQTI